MKTEEQIKLAIEDMKKVLSGNSENSLFVNYLSKKERERLPTKIFTLEWVLK